MSETITRQLEAELASLRAQLEMTDIFKDIQALERVIRRLKGDGTSSARATATERAPSSGRQEAATSIAMKDAAARFLEGKSQPSLTKEIYDALTVRGIHIPGEMPQNNLSAHLSRDPRFLSRGREGWVLSSSVTPDEAEVERVAHRYANEISPENLDGLGLTLNSSDGVPSEIDRGLLASARSALGRNLVEEEKRLLRHHFKTAIHTRVACGG